MKYIIESNDVINDVIGYTPKYAMLFGDGYMIQPLEDLEELNSDYFNEHFSDLQDTAYQRGLDDAWECMKSIAFLNKPRDMRDLFGCSTIVGVLIDYSAKEAIEKLKAYEEKQKAEEDVKRGDVVIRIDDNAKYLVTYVGDDRVCGISRDGKWNGANFKNVARTGEHHDIDKILEELQT